MIKLHANLSKKVPIEGLDYSSQSFSAGIEVEMGDGASDGEIRERIARLNQTLEAAIDAEISARSSARPERDSRPARRWNGNGNNGGNGNGRKPRSGGKATAAQLRAIFAIAKSNGINRNDLLNGIRDEHGVSEPEALTVRQASTVIEGLKQRQAS